MFKTITSGIEPDKDYPARCYRIDMLTRVLNGTIYDHLQYDFNTEKVDNTGEYIPLRQRRPSVTYRLAKIVVDESVSMLFSESHFPEIDCEDKTVAEILNTLKKESRLNEVMINAATIGSVGSVAVLMRVLNNRVFFKAMNTQHLIPTFDPNNPDKLIKIREQYKVKGKELSNLGYSIPDDDMNQDFWFAREWDDMNETFYLPWKVNDDKAGPLLDTSRSVNHSLGFVPVVWIKNLPGCDDIDGDCTFEASINTSIEIDYQLSQAGRGLKYSSDPTLMIREPAIGNSGQMIKGGGNALVVGEEGDAKLLEISGSAAAAVIEYVRCLRELALESVHGNRSNADKVSAAQSGRSQELMNQALVWLADRLRITYGEFGLLTLLQMVVLASEKYPLIIGGQKIKQMNKEKNICLRWPAWYSETAQDRLSTATTLKTLKEAGHISQETAVKTIAAEYDIEDVQAEIARIEKDEQEIEEIQQPKVVENI